jgi:phage terminase small subunit
VAERARTRRRQFVDAYLADPSRNAYAAALAAGYSERSAKSTASYLLKDPAVIAAIAAAERPIRDRYRLTRKRVLRELATVTLADLADYRVVGGQIKLAPGAQMRATRALSSVRRKSRRVRDGDGGFTTEHEIEFRLWDKTKALGLAMKHLGLLTDRIEVTNRDPQTWAIGGRTIVF